MIDASFWDAFWPDFFATLGGVAVGVPVALALDRFSKRRIHAEETRIRAKRLEDLLAVLQPCVDHNIRELKIMCGLAADDVFPASTLNVATWDALREEAFGLLPDADKRAILAHWFSDLRLVDRLAQHHFDVRFGAASALGHAVPLADGLLKALHNGSRTALADGEAINAWLEDHAIKPR